MRLWKQIDHYNSRSCPIIVFNCDRGRVYPISAFYPRHLIHVPDTSIVAASHFEEMDEENYGLLRSVAVGWTDEMLEQLLVKYKNDFQKVLDALLNDGPDKVKKSLFDLSTNVQHHDIVDLTGDDHDRDELRRAMQMSLAGTDAQFPLRPETNSLVQQQQKATFTSSNRAPLSLWAMPVPYASVCVVKR